MALVAVSLIRIGSFEAVYTLLLVSLHVSNSLMATRHRKLNHAKGLNHAKMCLNQN